MMKINCEKTHKYLGMTLETKQQVRILMLEYVNNILAGIGEGTQAREQWIYSSQVW